jgi:pyridoxal phosphate enzyme (YggS family)
MMQHILSETVIEKNYLEVQDRIAAAAEKAGRDAQAVRLVVVTKGHPAQAVQAAAAAGARRFGENYVEEAVAKIEALPSLERVDSVSPEWHMIGHVQSRKAQLVSEYFHWVHSLDSLKLARRLDRFASEAQRRLPALLECNVSAEESKFGLPAAREQDWERLLPEIEAILRLPNLQICGLMTMAPFFPDAERARPFFRRLRELRDFLAGCFPGSDWSELSMGMSGDYEVAVQEGATLVRVGQAILGLRPGY